MKSSHKLLSTFCLLLSGVVLMSGCAQNKQTIAQLEQENAQQRERIWRSNWKMEDFRRENESLRQQIAQLQGNSRRGATSAGTAAGTQSVAGTSANSAPGSSFVQPIPPASVPGASTLPTSEAPASGAVSGAQPAVTPQPPASTLGTPSSPQALPVNPPTGSQAAMGGATRQIHVRKTDSANVHSISILPEKAKAIHYEGIHAEFQLKDASGGIVLAPAPLVVMVTDPTLTGEQSKISKWKYTAEDIADIINSGQAGLTIPLNMAWERSCPQNLELELHILYYTNDKRILINRAKINLSQGNISVEPTQVSPNPQVGAQAAGGSASPLDRPAWSPEP